MKTGHIAAKTPARLDQLESIIRAAFVPPFYATLSTHQMAAEMDCSQGQIRQYLTHLERAGRVMKSPDGRWVPGEKTEPIRVSRTGKLIVTLPSEMQAAYAKYREELEELHADMPEWWRYNHPAMLQTETVDAGEGRIGISPALLREMQENPIGRSILQGLKTPAQEADDHEGLSPRD